MQMTGNLARSISVVRHENDPGAVDKDIFFLFRMHQVLQGAALRLTDNKRERFGSGHSKSSFFSKGYFYDGPMHCNSLELPPYFVLTCTSRGKKGSDAAGVLSSFSGTAVHDAWCSYGQYGCKHSLCNAHHLRELIPFAEEGALWAKDMIALLVEIKTAVERAQSQEREHLSAVLETRFEGGYQKLLKQGYKANPPPKEAPRDKRGRPKQTAARNLLLRLDTNRKQVLAFMYDFAIPFDNNLAERDLRMIKLRQKISGGFRTLPGAEAFCRVRGYLSTLRKQGKNILTALESVFRGSPEPVAPG